VVAVAVSGAPARERPTVVVIGAGFAGLAAAIRLVDSGCRVVVVERAPRGGGRATAFTDRDTGERVDNGQHVLFGCYRATYDLLARLGTADKAPLQPRLALTMADENGRAYELRCPDLPPPWHLLAGVLRWRALTVRDRLAVTRIGGLLRRARREGAARVAAAVPADLTVSQWLRARGQTRRLCEWLWYPLAYAALNQSPEIAAAAPFVRVVAELFGPRVEDAAVGLSRVPLDELYVEPARRVIEHAGGAVYFKTPARVLFGAAGRAVGVVTPDGEIAAEAVISAVPWHAIPSLWASEPPASLSDVVSHAEAMDSSPIVTVNLWVDGPVLPGPFVGLVGGPMHWAFDKGAILETPVRHLAMVASGAAELAIADNAAVTAAAVAQLSAAVPAMRQRRVERAVVVRETRATFSLAPGAPPRPGTRTLVDGFFLAGDWTETGLPATIEGAVVSGDRAAAAVAARLVPRP
jgi:hydroxysqualene dehydroxylase